MVYDPTIGTISSFVYRPTGLPNVQVEPWPVYHLERQVGKMEDGTSFFYYIETGTPKSQNPSSLRAEFFSNELQKVNPTNADSVLKFSEAYGVIPSPRYKGAQRLVWHRRRMYAPVPYTPSRKGFPTDAKAARADAAVLADIPPSELAPSLDPRHQSERARMLHLNDREVAGAISEAEVIETIRYLQVSTALATAVASAVESGNVPADAVARYLLDRSHLSQHGQFPFLTPHNRPMLGSRAVPYSIRYEDDEFRTMADAASSSQGIDATRVYAMALAEFLALAANRCHEFLEASLLEYREPMLPLDELASFSDNYIANEELLRASPEAQLNALIASEGNLGQAIIAQYSAIFNDPTPWRVCENCGKIFKKYHEERPGPVIQKTRFCKRSCANLFSRRRSNRLITE